MGRFPSGQREQTVNLSPDGFGGSNPPLPTILRLRFQTGLNYYCGNSSAVERQPSKLDVAGSNPVSRSSFCPKTGYALVAQLAEHILGKDEVTGSIPVKGSIRSADLFFEALFQVACGPDRFLDASANLVCQIFLCIGGMDVQSEV